MPDYPSRVLDYTIVADRYPDALSLKVREKLKAGWYLYGNLFYTTSVGFIQTMIKLNEPWEINPAEATYFVGDCACRPVPIPGWGTMIGGSDDCPVHGFGTEEEKEVLSD